MKHGGDHLRDFQKVLYSIETLLHCSAKSQKIQLDSQSIKTIHTRYLSKQNKAYEKNASAHVCIIHTRKECIAVGINDSPNGLSTSLGRHAEVDAICKLLQRHCRLPNKLMLLVLRFSKNGGINCSTPCQRCSRFIEKRLSMFRTVAFTNVDGGVVILTAEIFDAKMFTHISRRYRPLVHHKQLLYE